MGAGVAQLPRDGRATNAASEGVNKIEVLERMAYGFRSRANYVARVLGVLIGQNGYSQDLAFETLRITSQSQNRKLRHVAEEIVRTATSAQETSAQLAAAVAHGGAPG